jgi:hypothetical protein
MKFKTRVGMLTLSLLMLIGVMATPAQASTFYHPVHWNNYSTVSPKFYPHQSNASGFFQINYSFSCKAHARAATLEFWAYNFGYGPGPSAHLQYHYKVTGTIRYGTRIPHYADNRAGETMRIKFTAPTKNTCKMSLRANDDPYD